MKRDMIEKLMVVFPEINFTVRSLIDEEIHEVFQTYSNGQVLCDINGDERLVHTLKFLESELKNAKKKLKKAKSDHRMSKIPADEVFDHEWNIVEIKELIEDIKRRLNNR